MSDSASNPVPREPGLAEAYLGLDPVSVCRRLVAVLGDAAHGWRVGAEQIADPELTERMREIARRREVFAVELSNVVSGRSGQVVDEHTATGRILTWWLEIRALTAHDKTAAVLKVCRRGSRSLLGEYEQALDTALPEPIRAIVVRQFDDIAATAGWLDALGAED